MIELAAPRMAKVVLHEHFGGLAVESSVDATNVEELRLNLHLRIADGSVALEEYCNGKVRIARLTTVASLTNADFNWLTSAPTGARRSIRLNFAARGAR